MPQGKTEIKGADGKRGKMVYIAKKFKLGGRGQTTGAKSLSTAALMDRLTGAATSGKDQATIRKVLSARGVSA